MQNLNAKKDLMQILNKHGFSRRDFLKWSSAMSTMLGLGVTFAPNIANAVENASNTPVIWLHMAECTGCSESLLRSDAPTIDSLIFDYLNIEYHETVMAASGHQADENLENAIKKHAGKYVLLVEGAVPAGSSSFYLTLGSKGHTGEEIAKKACENAAAILAIGTCSSFGGIQAAAPNPTNAVPISKITNKSVINVPGCPPSEKNIVGSVLQLLLFGSMALDNFNRPKWAYEHRIHDYCERRGHFDAGEFVESFGDEGAKKGYCLYKVGCKGPYTFNNCAKHRFNQHTNWPIGAGHGCIGCSEPDFWDSMQAFEEPLKNKSFRTFFNDATSDKIGIGVLTLTGVAIAAHATISTIKKDKE